MNKIIGVPEFREPRHHELKRSWRGKVRIMSPDYSEAIKARPVDAEAWNISADDTLTVRGTTIVRRPIYSTEYSHDSRILNAWVAGG